MIVVVPDVKKIRGVFDGASSGTLVCCDGEPIKDANAASAAACSNRICRAFSLKDKTTVATAMCGLDEIFMVFLAFDV